MNLAGIIAISGRPGLFKVIAQGKNNIIVESLIDNKRFPAYASDRISALDDISIYTYEEDAPLRYILTAIFKKQDGKEAPSHKENLTVLQGYLIEILPNYDQERVYPSDIKKLFQWYNLLHSAGELKLEEKEETEKAEKKEKSEAKAPKAKKEAGTEEKPAKKAPAKKPAANPKAKSPVSAAGNAKPAAAKKTTATKTGTSRGK